MKFHFSIIFCHFALFSLLSLPITSQSPSSGIPGCISALTIDNINKCFACDSIDNWAFQYPAGCTCKKGYAQNKRQCRLICGDAIWTQQQCDDGNLIDNDGCTSQCHKQTDFHCVNLFQRRSTCRYQNPITSTVYSLSRKFGTSQLIIKFSFTPFHPILLANNWPQLVFVNTSKITFDSYEFQQDKILAMTYNINESIQGQTLKWTLSYDIHKFITLDNIHEVRMAGMNAPLTLEAFYSHQTALLIISYVIGGLSIVIGIVAMVKAQSNIAFELMTTLLFVFYSRILSYHQNPAILYCLNGLRISGIFNDFFPNEHRDYLEYLIKNRFFIKSELGLMSIMTLSLLGVVLILKVTFQLKSFFNLIFSNRISLENMKDKTKEWRMFIFFNKAYNGYQIFQKNICVPIILISQYTVLCAFNGFENAGHRYEPYFDETASTLYLLFFFIIIIYYLAVGASIIGNFLHKMKAIDLSSESKSSINIASHETASDYTDVYFLYLFVASIFLFFTTDFIQELRIVEWAIQISSGIVLTYIIGLLIFRPYQSRLHMFAIIAHELVKLAFLGFLFLIEKQLLAQIHQLIGVYIVLALLFILEVISIFRIKKSWILEEQVNRGQERRQAFNKIQGKPSQTVKKPKKRIRNDKQNVYLFQNILKQQKQEKQKQQHLNQEFKIIAKQKQEKKKRPPNYQKQNVSIHDCQGERERFTIFDGYQDRRKVDEYKKQQDLLELQKLKNKMRKETARTK